MKDFLIDITIVSLIFFLGFASAIIFGTVLMAGYMNLNLGILTELTYDFLLTGILIGIITLIYSYSDDKE